MTANYLRRDQLPGWDEYATRIDLRLLGAGHQRRARCPIHGGTRDSLAIDIDAGPWLCHSCGAGGGDVLAFHQQLHGLAFSEAARDLGAWDDGSPTASIRRIPARPASPSPRPDDEERTARILDRAARLWRDRRVIAADPDSPAARYLRDTRRVALPPANSDLAWHHDVREFGMGGPALIGRMSLASDHCTANGLHITWLQEDASGRWQRTERRYLGKKGGCVVRITPDEAVSYGLGIGEGIESTMSLALVWLPVWACLDAGNLAAFPVLNGIESLTIAADNDPSGTGKRAAEACAKRWHDAGCEVRIVLPRSVGADLNDVVVAA